MVKHWDIIGSMPLRHPHNVLLGLILLVGAFLRIAGFLTVSPPGPEHDEVANWLIDRAILAGQHAVYFTEAYGHEAGFHYWQTLFVWLVGDNLVALRASAALMGMLGMAVTFALTKRLFGRDAALIATALTATLFFPIFYSRLALRAISLPVTAGLAFCFFWDWLMAESPKRRNLLLAALFTGLSSYTYMASRALPIFYAGWIAYLALTRWHKFKKKWQDLLLFAAVYLLTSWPLIQFLQTLPTGETRVAEIDAPLRALLVGDFQPVLINAWAILLGFGISGDPLWRQGVAGQPIFEPIFATLFYAGLLISIWRWRDLRYGFLLLWLGASVVPSLVTVDAPSTIRMILMGPILAIFPVLGLEQILRAFRFSIIRTRVPQYWGVIHSYPQLSPGNRQLSTRKLDLPWLSLLTAFLMLFYGLRSGRDIFRTWPLSEEVQFVWQQSLAEMGHDIDQQAEIDHVGIAGWTPGSMDSPTMLLVVKREDVSMRHFGRVGEIETLVIPADAHTIYRPTDLPFHPILETELSQSHHKRANEDFVSYRSLGPVELDHTQTETLFFNPFSGFELTLLGFRFLETGETAEIQLVTHWQVEGLGLILAPDTKLFLHLVDADGNLLAQHDGLDAPHRFWQEGDVLMQVHTVPMIEGAAELRVGVYEGSPPWQRFMVEDGSDFIVIPFEE
ncbi:MAG: glycosyltransferase family 39 protein [Chloroflexota bacterium]